METELTNLVKNIAKKNKRRYAAYHIPDEDLCQEGFLAIEKAKLHYKSHYNVKFITYAYKAIQNKIHRYIAQNKAKLPVIDDYELETISDNEKLNYYDLKNALLKLTPEERQLIIYYYYNSLTYHEIAKRTGKSHNDAFIKIKNALVRLRRILGSHESD